MEPEQARFSGDTPVRELQRFCERKNPHHLELQMAGKCLPGSALWSANFHAIARLSATAVLVMALGIGATTSLFTIVRSVLLKPLPFREPDKLVMLYEHYRQQSAYPYNVVSPTDFRDWRAQTHGFQDMGAWRWWAGHISTMQGEMPEVVTGAGGSWNLFSVLGVQPVFGRTFTPDEDRFGANDVVMLSWSLFQSRFSGDKSIVGKQVRIDSKPYTVVGVLPAWFTYPDPAVKVWIPYTPIFMPEEFRPDNHQSHVVARLKDKQMQQQR